MKTYTGVEECPEPIKNILMGRTVSYFNVTDSSHSLIIRKNCLGGVLSPLTARLVSSQQNNYKTGDISDQSNCFLTC